MALPVILDATPLGGGHGMRGIGTAVRGLVEGFATLPPEDRPGLLLPDGTPVPAGFAGIPVRLPRWPLARLSVPNPWPTLIGGRVLRHARPALVHATHPDLMPRGLPVVATCHDLIPLRLGSLYLRGVAQRAAYRRYLTGLRNARRIIAPSQATADDLVRLLSVPASRIAVVPWGITPPAAAPSADHGPSAPYVLYTGSLEPHKNPHLAVDALAHAGDPDMRLVMVGPWSRRRTDRLRHHVAAAGMEGRVDLRGYVDAATLGRLQATAVATLVPSRIEGFGFPVLEAMAAGVPVIAGDAPALVEVAGGACDTLPVDRPDLWGREIRRLAHDPAARADAATRGRDRAARFTWTETARRTVAVYREVLDG